jgi:hypothetical protein
VVVIGMRWIVFAADGALSLVLKKKLTLFESNSVAPPYMVCAAFWLSAIFAFADESARL